jgi:hypothetical protein
MVEEAMSAAKLNGVGSAVARASGMPELVGLFSLYRSRLSITHIPKAHVLKRT